MLARAVRIVNFRLLIRLALLVAVLVLLHQGGERLQSWLELHLNPWLERWGLVFYVLALLLYALLLSFPFVPGVELGWALMMLLGVPGVIAVYLATVLGLALSFLVGRQLPLGWVCGLLGWLHLHRAEALVLRFQSLDTVGRLRLLLTRAPARVVPLLLRHRYLALAVAFNLPGNTLLGGGGGIGLLAGLSRLFALSHYLLTVTVAVAPVPVLVLVWHGLR